MYITNDKVSSLLKGKSQADIAREMNIPNTSVNVWLNGVRAPRYERLQHLASVLNMPVDELSLALRELQKARRQKKVLSETTQQIIEPVSVKPITTEPKKQTRNSIIKNKSYPDGRFLPNKVRFSVETSKDNEFGSLTFYADQLSNQRQTLDEFIDMARTMYPKPSNVKYEYDKYLHEHKIWLSF
jgi:transcriptional regulator with XRE-family HTH domain